MDKYIDPVKLQKFLEWFVTIRHPKDIWEVHQSYLICEITFYCLALLTLKHAISHGGRYMYLWIATVLHGLTVESVSYFVPDIDNFWHAQSMVMLLGKRLPLHIIFFYPAFLYTASVAVSKMRLRWAEPFAVGLAVVLLDIPFDIVGIKSLWWTWHDTDPNIFDRHYWVPLTSYYFHATFACSFTILFHGTRFLLARTEKYESASFPVEMICNILTGLLAFPLGVVQFIPIYHPLHDALHIPTYICVAMLLTLYVVMVWSDDRKSHPDAKTNHGDWLDEIGLAVFIHYSLFILLVSFRKPEEIRSTGLHQPVGPCNHTTDVRTPFGQILSKKTYLCPTDYDEAYFNFNCVKDLPKDGDEWYTICGTPYDNMVEYIVVVTAICCLGFFAFWQMLANSGAFPKVQRHPPHQHYHHKQKTH